MKKKVPKSKLVALAAVAALPVAIVVQSGLKQPAAPAAPVAAESRITNTDTPPVEPIEWTLIQLTGYDAEGTLHTMPLAMHPHTIFDLIGLPGDANVDGVVDIQDLNLVLTNFGATRQ